MSAPASLLSVSGLTVAYATPRGRLKALDDVSFSIDVGEALALVGESGSGKSTAALAVMGLLGPEASTDGVISFKGEDLGRLTADKRRQLRGNAMSIVFQDPFTSLNPSLPIGTQVAEPLLFHKRLSAAEATRRAIAALAEVGLPDAASLVDAYPHQLSGGMQQRVLIATALVCDPELLILDEPTTALDVTVEARILDLLDEIRRKRKLGILFITHNLGVVNRIAERVGVVYAGRIAEIGDKDTVLAAPSHPYTKGLLASLPKLAAEGQHKRLAPIGGRFPDLTRLPPGCVFADRCAFVEDRCRSEPQQLGAIGPRHSARCWKAAALADVAWPSAAIAPVPVARVGTTRGALMLKDMVKTYVLSRIARKLAWGRKWGLPWPRIDRPMFNAVDGVSLTIAPGEVVGLVGESGSGKSTLARLALRLIEANGGEVRFDGERITGLPVGALRKFRKATQIVFQNPDSSLNPRRTVGGAIARAVSLQTEVPKARRRAHVEDLIDRVGLPRHYYDRYPHQLSGGEKQRIGIARALATDPVLVVCDEPVSALDVSVQATVLNLLADLKDQYGLSYLFISHDLSVIAHISDRIAVMYQGRLVEIGTAEQVLAPPFHPYTEALLAAVPSPDPAAAHRPRVVAKWDAGGRRATAGCPFEARCPRSLGAICQSVPPPVVSPAPGHFIACHIPVAELARMPSPLAEPRTPALSPRGVP